MKQGLEVYKLRFNDYPPSFDDPELVRKHIGQLFPQWDEANDPLPSQLDAAEALVFWLRGFTYDPQRPIGGKSLAKRYSFFDFDRSRLVDADGDGYPEYEGRYCRNAPYVYFGCESYKTSTYGAVNGKHGIARPYLLDGGMEYAESKSFQIIAAGQDGRFSTSKLPGCFPKGEFYSPADRDNITTFSEGNTLENCEDWKSL